jgi:TetR/AcrR family transcriptional repressor of nem operon
MRVSNEEKERSRARILAEAAKLFRREGVAGASVGDIMQAAGMTHGGFYRHFADKEELLAAAITDAFDTFAAPLREAEDPAHAVARFQSRYLSGTHRANPERGCPAAALGIDVARADDRVRSAFSLGVEAMAKGIARGIEEEDARAQSLRMLSMLVGAMVLARATDDRLAASILSACREAALPQPKGSRRHGRRL